MCLAIPMRVTQIEGATAIVEVSGITRKVRIDLLSDVELGDFVLVHAGLAIAKIDTHEAEETLALLKGLTNEI
ncbi:MAG: HypC/HybG/HupF family hydrogenase formation chaperone [Armatimonadetes bacterium]|nr:HypC/HybG/HupF family hydrogenase formation chaperone [Armatimonadota bacterium]